MASKIFVSYKYGDNQVFQGLDSAYWADGETEATGRGYANLIEEIIGRENTYKGEREGESLKGKTEAQIWEILKPKVHDSSVTLILISRNMKNILEPEGEQWMPQEIRYSLWENERGDKTSLTNALLGVIIPDRDRSYEYIYEKSNCNHCGHIRMLNKQNNPYLFNILKGNIFNRKNDGTEKCEGLFCNSIIYNGDHSYLHLVTLDEFLEKPSAHIDTALKIKDNGSSYDIEKTI